MKKLFFATLFFGTTYAFAQPAAPVLKNAVDSFSYALGINVAQSIKDQGLTTINHTIVGKAFEDVMKGQPGMTQEVAMTILQNEMKKVMGNKLAAEKAKGTAFLEENKKRSGVVVLPNGLQYEVLEPGDPNGKQPTINDKVKVDYVGTFIDGVEFDGSIKRGEPIEFPVSGVIPGWTQILQLMKTGAKWKVFIPSDLAYGDSGTGGAIPPGATLIFTIILHEVNGQK